MCLELVEICVVRKIFCKMLILAERVKINEYSIALDFSRIGNFQMSGIGIHTHDLLLDILLRIGKINAVSERLAHLGFSVCTRKAETCVIIRKKNLRLDQRMAVTVCRVELSHDFSCLLDHRFLILTDRNGRCLKRGDIGSLADRIGKETDRDAVLELSHLDLGLDRRISLKSCDCDQIHIVESQLCEFHDLRLNEQVGLFGIKSDRKVIERYLNDIFTYLLRIVHVVCQSLRVCYHDINFIKLP